MDEDVGVGVLWDEFEELEDVELVLEEGVVWGHFPFVHELDQAFASEVIVMMGNSGVAE